MAEKSDTEVKLQVKLDNRTKELKTANERIAELEKVDESRLTNDELATELVAVMSAELHLRVGIGPIWRQLNPTRKQEIIEKWIGDVEKILSNHR